jgi:hypothetical protein
LFFSRLLREEGWLLLVTPTLPGVTRLHTHHSHDHSSTFYLTTPNSYGSWHLLSFGLYVFIKELWDLPFRPVPNVLLNTLNAASTFVIHLLYIVTYAPFLSNGQVNTA